MERLHKSCRRLIWVNPLLRYDEFAAKARGVRAMLPYVDEFRPIHNLASMAELCRALSQAKAGRRRSEDLAAAVGVGAARGFEPLLRPPCGAACGRHLCRARLQRVFRGRQT